MSEIQPIIHHGSVAGVVVADQAIIPDALPGQEQMIVKAMCLYALEVAEGRLPGPYSDARALAYARTPRPCATELDDALHGRAISFRPDRGVLVADPVPVRWKPKDERGADKR